MVKDAAAWIFRLKFIYDDQSYQLFFKAANKRILHLDKKNCWRQNKSLNKLKLWCYKRLGNECNCSQVSDVTDWQ